MRVIGIAEPENLFSREVLKKNGKHSMITLVSE